MSCGCNKHKPKAAGSDDIKTMALKLSKKEKTDYVIYEQEEKRYFDRKECWTNAGRPGELLELVCNY